MKKHVLFENGDLIMGEMELVQININIEKDTVVFKFSSELMHHTQSFEVYSDKLKDMTKIQAMSALRKIYARFMEYPGFVDLNYCCNLVGKACEEAINNQ